MKNKTKKKLGSVNFQEWNYYYFDNTFDNGVINVHMQSSNDADVYVKYNLFPTVFQWDYANNSAGSDKYNI